MTTSIIGLFESAEFAKKVLGELARIGCKKDAMEILQDAFTDRISDRLLEAGSTRVTRRGATPMRCRRAALWSLPKPTTTKPMTRWIRCGAWAP
jgi:hypothetical protein